LKQLIAAAVVFIAIWLFLLAAKRKLAKLGVDVQPLVLMVPIGSLKAMMSKAKLGKLALSVSAIAPHVALASGAVCIAILVKPSIEIIRGLIAKAPAKASPAVQILVPGVSIPLVEGVVSIAIAAIVHELMHGLVATGLGVKVRSAGLALLAIIPAAYVDPDEEEMKLLPPKSRAKIVSAGSLGNYITAGFFLLFLVSFFGLLVSQPSGVLVESVVGGAPAEVAGLKAPCVILYLNNTRVRTIHQLYTYLSATKPGDLLLLRTTRGDFLVKLGKHPNLPDRGFIGIVISPYDYYSPTIKALDKASLHWLWHKLEIYSIWILAINVGIALVNSLPIPPLDGWLLMDCLTEALQSKSPRKGKAVKLLKISLAALSIALLSINVAAAVARLIRW